MSKLSPDKYFKSLSKLYINLIFKQLVFLINRPGMDKTKEDLGL